MATLEARQPTQSTAVESVPTGVVPSAFPEEQRGRASAAKQVQTSAQQLSRSPPPVAGSHLANGSQERRSSLARAMDSIRRTVTRDQSQGPDSHSQERGRRQSFASEAGERSQSRGRLQHVLPTLARSLSRTTHTSTNSRSPSSLPTGRGGAGNMLPTSPEERDPRLGAGEESPAAIQQARSASRGRSQQMAVAGGRGGAGNMRSRSRGRELDNGGVAESVEEEDERRAQEKEELVEAAARAKFEEQSKGKVYSTGRGGRGNVHA